MIWATGYLACASVYLGFVMGIEKANQRKHGMDVLVISAILFPICILVEFGAWIAIKISKKVDE